MSKFLFLALLFSTLSCHSQIPERYEAVESPVEITKSLMDWLYYEAKYIDWSADYVPLDSNFKSIDKDLFFEKLITGKYFPLNLKTKNNSLYYQLSEIDADGDKEIGKVIRQKALMQYKYFKMEGRPLPSFSFTDLNDQLYDSNTTKGKIVVLNCWFINCLPCLQEMPSLNKLVAQYKNRNDIVFLGLAFDEPEDLKIFLKKQQFSYAIIGDKKNYLTHELGIVSYPTHLIVNREGKIVKVISRSIDELQNVLNKELGKDSIKKN